MGRLSTKGRRGRARWSERHARAGVAAPAERLTAGVAFDAGTIAQLSSRPGWFPSVGAVTEPFDDLMTANREFASTFTLRGYDGIAHAGVAVVTCMDSRIDPLRMLGLKPGDAKIFRNPGGRVTQAALEALVLCAHLLNVDRILVVPHTRCTMASNTEHELRDRVSASAGQDASWQSFSVVDDQLAALHEDVRKVRSHPLIPDTVAIGGFVYDVDTGLIEQKV